MKEAAKHGPAPHHYYVTIMAVEPTQQGKGSRLMRTLQHRIGGHAVGSYRDPSSLSTEGGPWYKITEQVTLLACGDAITVYSMLKRVSPPEVNAQTALVR